jgi:hypothetical protein
MTSTLGEIETLARELAVHKLYAEYAHRVDDGDIRAWSQLWTETGAMIVRGNTHQNREGVYNYLAGARGDGVDPLARHFVLNVEPTLSGDTAHVVADFTHIVASSVGAGIEMVGRYISDLVWQDGRWWFDRHEVVLLVDRRDASKPIG